MPIEKRPLNLVPRNYAPENSRPYKVKSGDSWVSIAKANNLNVWQLIMANFKTKNPAEVNWYLRHYVGCNKMTPDKKNWMFSSSAQPGIIHIPARVINMPPLIVEGRVPPKINLWAGIGKSHSGDLFVIGAHDITARLYNFDDSNAIRNATVNINGWKFGAGLGASIGAVLVIAHGFKEAKDMNGVKGGWDFDIALGTRLSDALKGIKGLGKAIDTYDKYKKLRYLTENIIKNVGITETGIYTIPIPLSGVGLHVWGGFAFGDVSVWNTGEGL